MYTQKQLKDAMQELRQGQPLTAASVHHARELMNSAQQNAIAAQQAIDNAQSGYGHLPSHLRAQYLEPLYAKLQAAKLQERDALAVYQDVNHRGAHLLLQEREQQRLAEVETRRKEAAEQEARRQQAEAREEFRRRYMAAGGSEQEFTAAWPGLWSSELERRTFEGRDVQLDRLRASGRYV